ncbi:MAG TPA: glycine cleavage T C-terminal barrel domain-containing protein [Verrucomicrobiae bacterium]|nr:glycine cleavage T C-terminal barrel domain-containing protein [Verrucomicrobiae bacterium]
MEPNYGDWLAEYRALRETAGLLDLSARSRLCVVGADRVRFLHGQVTNDIKKLRVGEGCYAAITTNKGRMESDLNIFVLPDELLLDFEPGLAGKMIARLEKFIVADEVQIVDVAAHYGLLSVQGPKAGEAVRALDLGADLPEKQFASVKVSHPAWGEIYLARHARLGGNGFDLFVPTDSLASFTGRLLAATKNLGGRQCGSTAYETARVENGLPRFGADMDETNLPPECGIEARAISYQKGCYIGQEVLNRIHSIGRVNRELCGLRLADDGRTLPVRGDGLFHDGKEVGVVTSAVRSPSLGPIALGCVRREAGLPGTALQVRRAEGDQPATVTSLPFMPFEP